MRGSPLLRTLAVLAALVLTALGLSRFTSPPDAIVPEVREAPPEHSPVRRGFFELVLSSTASEVTLESGDSRVLVRDTAEPLTGNLEIDPDRPFVSLAIKWAESSPGHRFAKLRIDEAGKDSREHVFTAAGDIDDIWELEP